MLRKFNNLFIVLCDMAIINAKNANSEMSKRIKITKEMLGEGKTVIQIANYFGLSVDTIKKYITHLQISGDNVNLDNFNDELSNYDNKKFNTKSKKVLSQKIDTSNLGSLNSQNQKQLKKDEEFIESEKRGGYTCRLCNSYKKLNSVIKWKKNVYVCKSCFATLEYWCIIYFMVTSYITCRIAQSFSLMFFECFKNKWFIVFYYF